MGGAWLEAGRRMPAAMRARAALLLVAILSLLAEHAAGTDPAAEGAEGGGAEGGGADAEEHVGPEEGSEDVEAEEMLITSPIALNTVVGIVFALIVSTLLFENLEHFAMQKSGDLKPVISQLFSELTVLGFLSMSMFLAAESGVIATWSMMIFGEEAELMEYMEKLHMLLLLIMLIFIVQVAAMVYQGMKIHEVWAKYEERAVQGDSSPKVMFDTLKQANRPGASHEEVKVAEYMLMRYAFVRYPETDPKKVVDGNFRLDWYFKDILTIKYKSLVTLDATAWSCFGILALVIRAVVYVDNHNVGHRLVGILLGWGYLLLLAVMWVDRKISSVQRQIMPTTASIPNRIYEAVGGGKVGYDGDMTMEIEKGRKVYKFVPAAAGEQTPIRAAASGYGSSGEGGLLLPHEPRMLFPYASRDLVVDVRPYCCCRYGPPALSCSITDAAVQKHHWLT